MIPRTQKIPTLVPLVIIALIPLVCPAEDDAALPVTPDDQAPAIELVDHSKGGKNKRRADAHADPIPELEEMRRAVADLKLKIKQLCEERDRLKLRVAAGDKSLEERLLKSANEQRLLKQAADEALKKLVVAQDAEALLQKKLDALTAQSIAAEKRANQQRAEALRERTLRMKLEAQIKKSAAAAEREKAAAAKKRAAEAKLFDIAPIYFGKNRAASETQEHSLLVQIQELHKTFPRARFMITGYTCTDGTPANNLALSRCRAQRIAALLKNNGIPASAISGVVGKGEADPIGDNALQGGREANRRVEIKVLRE